MYVDIEGEVEAINNKTGERAELKFNTRGWSVESTVECKIYDSHGNHVYNIEGSWLNRLDLVSCQTGQKELLWEETEKIEDSHRMFGFSLLAVNMNYKCDQMEGVVAPTDSRFRPDQRLLENGQGDQADEEKIRLEVKQRAARKLRNDQGLEWTPNFFRQGPHPYIEGETVYEFIEENNYW